MTTAPISEWFIQGDNLHTIVFDAQGRVANDVVWAAADGVGRTVGTVTDYRGRGYEILRPADVETLPGGTYRPEKAKYGVMFEFDRKSDRVTNTKNMVLLYKPAHVAKQQAAELEAKSAQFRRKVATRSVERRAGDRVDAAVDVNVQDEG